MRQAWERYRDAHLTRKRRGKATIKSYTDHFDRLLADWLDLPIAKLAREPQLVRDRHDSLTRHHDPYMANVSMRSLRAVYNHARKSVHDLPVVNPVLSVDWNKESRRQIAMGLGNLKPWFEQLGQIAKPIRREFHLFLLLSGSRPDALKRARVSDLDLRRVVLHIPRPKGGTDRAFDVPLSREMVNSQLRAIRMGQALFPVQSMTFLFPAESPEGHLVKHKEKRRVLSK